MTSVLINAPAGYYICYKSGTGRSVAFDKSFATEKWAQAYLDAKGRDCDPPTDFNQTMWVIRKDK